MKITVTPQKYKKMVEKLGQYTTRDMIRQDQLTEYEIKELVGLFPKGKVGEAVEIGDLRQYENELYECIQAHTTQSDGTPDVSSSLGVTKSVPGIIPAGEQPEGSHDAYDQGDKVTHNGKTGESDIDGNVGEPPEQWTEI